MKVLLVEFFDPTQGGLLRTRMFDFSRKAERDEFIRFVSWALKTQVELRVKATATA